MSVTMTLRRDQSAVAITLFAENAYLPSETWARRAYPSVNFFLEVKKDGHFAASEQPELSSPNFAVHSAR
jgi:hypothetical protein